MSACDVMAGQVGNRVIIRWKPLRAEGNMKLFMPNDKLNDGTVIASVIYREDDSGAPEAQTVIVLNPAPPFYSVMIIRESVGPTVGWVVEAQEDHMNIVDAVNGDDFPNVDPTRPHAMVGPRRLGYVDMGGDA